MLLDVSRALSAPGEEIPFLHRDEIAPQDVFGETVTFTDVLLSGHYAMAGDSLHIRGTLTASAHGQCAGCLKDVEYPLEVPFDEIFAHLERYPRNMDDAREGDDDERLVFEGHKVELSHLALTLAVLELPMRFTCGQSCPAMADPQPESFQNSHACQKDMPDQHPFSALQQLLTKDQEV